MAAARVLLPRSIWTRRVPSISTVAVSVERRPGSLSLLPPVPSSHLSLSVLRCAVIVAVEPLPTSASSSATGDPRCCFAARPADQFRAKPPPPGVSPNPCLAAKTSPEPLDVRSRSPLLLRNPELGAVLCSRVEHRLFRRIPPLRCRFRTPAAQVASPRLCFTRAGTRRLLQPARRRALTATPQIGLLCSWATSAQ